MNKGKFKISTRVSQVALVVKNPTANAGDIRHTSSIPGLGRSPGEGHGNPFQNSCLENPMKKGAWWASVHSITKSQALLKWLSMHVCRTYSQRIEYGNLEKYVSMFQEVFMFEVCILVIFSAWQTQKRRSFGLYLKTPKSLGSWGRFYSPWHHILLGKQLLEMIIKGVYQLATRHMEQERKNKQT